MIKYKNDEVALEKVMEVYQEYIEDCVQYIPDVEAIEVFELERTIEVTVQRYTGPSFKLSISVDCDEIPMPDEI